MRCEKFNKKELQINYEKEKGNDIIIKKINANKCSKEYADLLQEIYYQKRNGDWVKIGEKLGISRELARQSFLRIDSPNHENVIKELVQLIKERKNKQMIMIKNCLKKGNKI
jgi:hypothetical protein